MGQIILAMILGTSFMTLFSYLLSYTRRKQFREPVLLNRVFKKPSPDDNPAGWVLHYFVGLIFVLILYFFWSTAIVEPSLLSGAVFGFVFGIVGIIGWSLVFLIRPLSEVDIKEYYLQLMAAHIIFGIGAAVGYLLPVWLQE